MLVGEPGVLQVKFAMKNGSAASRLRCSMHERPNVHREAREPRASKEAREAREAAEHLHVGCGAELLSRDQTSLQTRPPISSEMRKFWSTVSETLAVLSSNSKGDSPIDDSTQNSTQSAMTDKECRMLLLQDRMKEVKDELLATNSEMVILQTRRAD